MHERKNGLQEGIARGLSQACVYCIEAHKTVIQVYGKAPKIPAKQFISQLGRGMIESATTSTLIFGSYFTVYHSIGSHNLLAGPVSAFTTSFIKIPISNSMRLTQAGMARNVLDAGSKIIKAKSIKGLYGGYVASLAEDIIEFDLRTRMYNGIKQHIANQKRYLNTSQLGIFLGGMVGMFAACVTTPFDTVRAHIAIDAAKMGSKKCVLTTTKLLWKQGGIPAFYRGMSIRALSSAIKSSLFYMFFETLQGLNK
jgi:hypothetical protein